MRKKWKEETLKYRGTNGSIEGTPTSYAEQSDRRELRGTVNNKGDDSGMKEIKSLWLGESLQL